jgi:NADP-dependent 3-hydroxy acid dehydrogenase YdfG
MTDMAAAHANTGALQPDWSVRKEPTIDAKHVGSSIVHIASLPLDVTVLEMNIM